MHLVTNSVSPTQVHETDDAWVIEDVPIHKPLDHLDGGYTPRENVERTVGGWHGVPVTLNHPRDDSGTPMAAHTDPERIMGEVRDPEWDGEAVRVGELEVRKADLDRLGQRANAVREALSNGDPLHVSSQYSASDLPPGEYDGEFRSNASRIDRPDSVAIVTRSWARCSIEDGCGINPQMVANADVTVPMTDDPISPESGPGEASGDPKSTMKANQDLALTDVGPGDVDEYTDTEWDGSEVTAALPNPSDNEDAPGVLDATHMVHPTSDEARDSKANWKLPFRSGPDAPVNTRALVAIDAALSGARGGVDGVGGDLADAASSRVQSFLEDAPADLFGASGEAMKGNSVTELVVNTVASLWPGRSTDTETRGAESPAEPDETPSMGDNLENESMIEELAANSEFDRENLVKWDGTDCLANLHAEYVANGGGDPEGGEDAPTNGGGEDPGVIELTEDELMARVDERAEQKAEAMVANREAQAEKADLASTIVANSAEYDSTEDVLEDFPTVAALESKRDSVTAQAGVPGTGATAEFAANAEDDDLTEDVSAGVF